MPCSSMLPVRPLRAFAVGLVLIVARPAFAQAPTDVEARIRALEEQLESTTRRMNAEIEALRSDLRKATAQAAAAPTAPETARALPAPAPAVATTPAAVSAAKVDDLVTMNRETREQVATLQSRLDSQVPNARLGEGLVFDDPRGRWSLRLTGRMQSDVRLSEGDVLSDTVSIRRARIGAGLTSGPFGGYIETELTAGALGGATPTNGQGTGTGAILHQAFIDFSPKPALRLRLGQFRPQLGLENSTTTWQVDFQERSLAFALTQNFLFDRGLMASGVPLPGMTYAISLMNGTGTGTDELQRSPAEVKADGKDLLIRLTADAARWADLQDTVVHVGGNWRQGEVANGAGGYLGPSAQTEARGLVFFSPQPFNNAAGTAAAGTIDRNMVGLEGALAWRSFKLSGEFWRARYSGSTAAGGFNRDIRTGYVAVNWLATGEYFSDTYRNGVFGRLRPNNAFSTGADSGWGAVMLGLRYSAWDASDFGGNAAFTGNVAADTSLVRPTVSPSVSNLSTKAQAWTVALKWLPTPYWAFMVNYVHTEFGTTLVSQGQKLDSENALTFRGQFDFF